VAYLPTFREDGAGPMPMDLDRLLDLPALEAVCQKYGLVFLVKFHQWTPGLLSAGYEHIIELKENSLHVQMLLDAADILITDYSSCFVDHLLLDRPQILFAYDLDHYMTHERNLYGDFRADATGRLCEDNAALLDELEKLAQGRDEYAGRRHRIRDFYYNPENQCSVASKQVEKILSL
jgi:CDP-glycerol glycerophosphotransferase (TagB/SpsB family)